jgi:hypothetical protein
MKSNKSMKGGGTTELIVSGVMIILVVAIIIGLSYYFQSYSVRGNVTRDFLPFIHDAKIAKRVNQGAIPSSSQGNEYNLNFWVYINDYTYRYNDDKVILNRNNNPNVMFSSNTNSLKVLINVEDNLNDIDGEEDDTSLINVCEVKDIPLQRWVNINLSLNNKVMDIFMDGKLSKTCIINGYPKPNIGSMDITPNGGFNGFISSVRFSNSALSLNEIGGFYKKGPSL